ncbi:TetR family transcriptional regulator [Burkholderia stagnalis]
MRRTREQALATRAIIVDAAGRVFYDQGVARASLDEIARRAGVSRGAVYWHFESKFVLLDAIYDDAAIPLDPFVVPCPAAATKTIEALIDSLGMCWRAATRSGLARRLYTLSFARCEDASETAAFCQRVRHAGQHAERRIEVWVRCAMTNRQLPEAHDARKIAHVIHATLTGLLRKVLVDPKCSNLDVVDITNIVRILLQGYSSIEGARQTPDASAG